jgi:hypothetical protein
VGVEKMLMAYNAIVIRAVVIGGVALLAGCSAVPHGSASKQHEMTPLALHEAAGCVNSCCSQHATSEDPAAKELASMGLSCFGGDPELMELASTHRPWLPQIPADHVGEIVPISVCYDPSSPPSPQEIAAINAIQRAGLPRYNATGRWTTTGTNGANIPPGTPITITWSLVPDTVSNVPDLAGVNGASTLFATMDAKFGGNRALWISKIEQSFQRWGALTGVNYVRVRSGTNDWDDGAAWGTGGNTTTRGDVRIGMRDFGSVNGVLAFNNFPNSGDMVLDSRENWQSSANDYRFMRNIIMHEHGHGLGLAHVCPQINTKLMEPSLATNFDGPQQDDIRAVHALYGDINEPNNTLGTSTGLLAMNVPSSQIIGTIPTPNVTSASTVSIHNNGDEDWYSVNFNAGGLLNVTLAPVGSVYDSGVQTQLCDTGTSLDSRLQADIGFHVRNTVNTTIFSGNLQPVGTAETVTGVLVGPGMSLRLRVFETGSPTQSQAYRLTLATSALGASSATTLTRSDGINLTWPTIVNSQATIRRNTIDDVASGTILDTVSTNSYLDTTAVPGVDYFYWVDVLQTPNNEQVRVAGPLSGIRRCAADLGSTGGASSPDNLLDNNDFIVFIDRFFAMDAVADVGGEGGVSVGDGLFDNNDFIVFIEQFFLGCPQ